MLTYMIRMSQAATRGLRSIPSPIAGYVGEAIQGLAYNPRPLGCEPIGPDKYRMSEWGWIIEYEVHREANYVLIFYIG